MSTFHAPAWDKRGIVGDFDIGNPVTHYNFGVKDNCILDTWQGIHCF